MLAPHLAASGAARRRFAREAKAAAAFLHPNVIAIQIVEGLAAAHSQGLVHRDIEPANILPEEGVERVSITDFGLARAVDDATLTHSGVIAGTPQYMSPEQARGESIDSRSDLFSLGSVMYAMCTGRAPFRTESSYGILRRITDVSPRPIREVNPEIPAWLCRLVNRLHEKSPDDRYQSAAAVGVLLMALKMTTVLYGPDEPQRSQRAIDPGSAGEPSAGQTLDILDWNDTTEPALQSVQDFIRSLDQETRRSFDESE